jgi:uncharacterized protein
LPWSEEKLMRSESTSKPLAVITGASSGIGYELARQFATHGFDLIITAESDAIQAAQASLSSIGPQVAGFQADLTTFEGVEQLWEKIREARRPIAAAAINAGVGVWGGFAHTELQAELKMIQLNISSAVHLTKRVVGTMLEQGHGRILLTSSIDATMPAPLMAVYGATKAFGLYFAEALRSELEGTGITVTALMPGATETNFFRRAGMEHTRVGSDKKDSAAEVARQGYDALMAGREKVVASSLKSKLMGFANRLLPDAVTARMHRRMAEPQPGRATRH